VPSQWLISIFTVLFVLAPFKKRNIDMKICKKMSSVNKFTPWANQSGKIVFDNPTAAPWANFY
jgi:hypothetical protein